MFDRLVVSFFVDEIVGGFFINVPPGHVACVFDRGKGVLKKVWSPGLHLKIPFWQIAKLFNVQTLEYNIAKGFSLDQAEALGDEPLNAVTSDNRLVTIEGAILFRLNKEHLPELWENIGEKFVSKIVRPVSRSRIRSVIAKYSADQVRGNSRQEIEEKVLMELDQVFRPHGLITESVLFSEIKPSGIGF